MKKNQFWNSANVPILCFSAIKLWVKKRETQIQSQISQYRKKCIFMYTVCVKKNETRVWLPISQTRKKLKTKLFQFHLVHCSFIFGHGWLHSNQFWKTYQDCFCLSWRCLRCMMAFITGISHWQSNNSCIRTALCTMTTFGRRQFWHALQKWLLSSHPWPNMNGQTMHMKEK